MQTKIASLNKWKQTTSNSMSNKLAQISSHEHDKNRSIGNRDIMLWHTKRESSVGSRQATFPLFFLGGSVSSDTSIVSIGSGTPCLKISTNQTRFPGSADLILGSDSTWRTSMVECFRKIGRDFGSVILSNKWQSSVFCKNVSHNNSSGYLDSSPHFIGGWWWSWVELRFERVEFYLLPAGKVPLPSSLSTRYYYLPGTTLAS